MSANARVRQFIVPRNHGAAAGAEDDGKALILRLYEAYGNRTEATLTLPGEYRILETDLMENVMGEAGKGRSVTLLFHPFEIRALRLEAVNG